MTEITLEINQQKEAFAAVWVHLQDAHANSVPYKIRVPASNIIRVFDPSGMKDADESWTAYIRKMIGDLGTFIVEGYIENMASLCGEQNKAYKWVIASVDNVYENESGIEVVGRAVPFKP